MRRDPSISRDPYKASPRANPAGNITDSDKEMPLIYGKVLKYEMVKTAGKYKGQKFFHRFKPGTKMYGLPEGAVITLPSGRQITLKNRCVLTLSDHSLWGLYA